MRSLLSVYKVNVEDVKHEPSTDEYTMRILEVIKEGTYQ